MGSARAALPQCPDVRDVKGATTSASSTVGMISEVSVLGLRVDEVDVPEEGGRRPLSFSGRLPRPYLPARARLPHLGDENGREGSGPGPAQALGQATTRQAPTKATLSPTCIQPSQARRRGRAGSCVHSVMPRTTPYRPGNAATARIQVGR